MKQCEYCRQDCPEFNLFLCKGKMACNGCFRKETRLIKIGAGANKDEGNQVFINEDDYRRDKHGKVNCEQTNECETVQADANGRSDQIL